MTLVVGIVGRESTWLVADRRLSVNGRPVAENARKIMFLDTSDGVGILGYAGLGATALGTEPADWMSRVLRGRPLPLEKSLGAIVDAMRRQFPPHMRRMPRTGAAHYVVATAFLDGKPVIYNIGLILSPDRKNLGFGYARMVAPLNAPLTWNPRISTAGSGSTLLAKDQQWVRDVLRLVKAHDSGRISAPAVAERLAALNFGIHRKDPSVGANCIVAWRFRKGGGAHMPYEGVTQGSSVMIPTVASGMDVNAIARVMMPIAQRQLEAMRTTGRVPEIDAAAIEAALAGVHVKTDENLR